MTLRIRLAAATFLALCVCLPFGALAQTGVSDDRVSLPSGPGSLEGVGENASINPNMGLMSYSINVALPEGFPSMTPSVGLGYSSGAGNSVVGVGWSMAVPSIERMTSRGLPDYDTEDLFAANGGAQLVAVSGGDDAVYRERFEGGFVRYTWVGRGGGAQGYWTAEYPDGRVGYFGADSDGVLVPSAREGGDEGTHRYLLVEVVDVWGQRMRHTFTKTPGGAALLSRASYVYFEGAPRFEVAFDYEARRDAISDGKGGFLKTLDQRLTGIRVISGGVQIQRYALGYEAYDAAGGVSRLASFERFGLRDEIYPTAFGFDYSESLGGVCDGQGCDRPFTVSMGRLGGVNLQSGNATLIDLNGDALPDVLDTTGDGPHRIFLNRFRNANDHTFEPAAQSALGAGVNHGLAAGNVQTLDVDGDGFSDLINTRTGRVLENKGGGDWAREYTLFEQRGDLPDLSVDLDPEDGDLTSIRFVDINNDKRIDLIKSLGSGQSNQTTVYLNTEAGAFAQLESAESLGLGFDSDRLQLADVNGDGLLDAVLLRPAGLTVRLNLGRGKWGPQFQISDLPFDESDIPFAELEDLNNDGLTDLVVVRGSEVRYALGLDGVRFDGLVTVTSATIDGTVPPREAATTVLFADMNGNGSSDIVWISAEGDTTYLELFAVQPGLLSRIENGLGMVQEITYATSIDLAARSAQQGEPWAHLLPYPMTLVTSLDVYDRLNNLHQITELSYRDGFYDGQEKQFRGFGHVVTTTPGDDTMEAGTTRLVYDLGMDDPHRAGLLLEQQMESDARVLQVTRNTYEDCPVDGVEQEGLDFPVRFVCGVAVEQILQEGTEAAQHVVAREETTYDGYGNPIATANLGVVSIGGGGCEPCERGEEVFGTPCGETCQGDEIYREIDVIPPTNTGGRWILGRPSAVRIFGRDGSAVNEKHMYYDGEPFVGLSAGTLTHGAMTRTTIRLEEGGPMVNDTRMRVDSRGRAVEVLYPRGTAEIADDHRMIHGFDAMGLRPVSTEYLLTDADGRAYRQRQETLYDTIWLKPVEQTQWMIVEDGRPITGRNASAVRYDSFGRVDARFVLGDPDDKPTERYTYDFGDPTSRVLIERRSEQGGDFDRATVRCYDGFGRQIQERVQLESGTWLVSGFQVFNANGQIQKTYRSHKSDSGACDTAEPAASVPYQTFFSDALGRVVRSTLVSGDDARQRRYVHGPLSTLVFDFEDTDPNSPHFDTPTREDYDGLGRRTRVAKMSGPTEAQIFDYTYTPLNHFRGIRGPGGHEIVQSYNLVGWRTQIDDPDRGLATFEYDLAGNVIRKTDARGSITGYTHDAQRRLQTVFDAADPDATRTTYRYDLPRDCPAEDCTNTAGRLVEIDFPTEGGQRGQFWYGYNAVSEQSYHARVIRNQPFEFRWRHNHSGQLVETTFPDGQTLTMNHDFMDRVRSIDGVIDAIEFNDRLLPASFHMANGTTEHFSFNARHQVDRLEITAGDGSVLADRNMAFDKQGNLLSITDGAARPDAPSADALFTYDALYRMTEVHLDRGREGFDEVLVYQYDPLDNLTRKMSSMSEDSAAHVGALTYGGSAGPHAVDSAGDLTFAYDAAGHTTRRGNASFSWNSYGQLESISEGGREVERAIYGPDSGRLFTHTDRGTVWHLGRAFEIRDGVSSVIVSQGGRQFARLSSTALAATVLSDLAPLVGNAPDPDGQITAGDAFVSQRAENGELDLGTTRRDGPGDLLQAVVAGLLVGDGDKTFIHTDHRGSVIATTDAEGGVLSTQSYYPYGMARHTNGDVSGFHQKESDAIGMIDHGMRRLDPVTGRWLSPDPLYHGVDGPGGAFPSEIVGAYVAMVNNPASYRDDDGRFVEQIGGTFVAIAAGSAWALGGIGAGVADGLWDIYSEQRINPSGVTGTRVIKSLGSLVFSGAVGAATLLATGGWGIVSYTLTQLLTDVILDNVIAGYPDFSPQAKITTRRVVKAGMGSLLGAMTLGIFAVSGGTVPAMIAIGAGVGFLLKTIHAGIQHVDGYSRAGAALKRGLNTRGGRIALYTVTGVLGVGVGALIAAGIVRLTLGPLPGANSGEAVDGPRKLRRRRSSSLSRLSRQASAGSLSNSRRRLSFRR